MFESSYTSGATPENAMYVLPSQATPHRAFLPSLSWLVWLTK